MMASRIRRTQEHSRDQITNALANRIIGDHQLNVAKSYTFTSPKFYKADSKLAASGLLGPVKIIRTAQQ
jgi:hypothetical protein